MRTCRHLDSKLETIVTLLERLGHSRVARKDAAGQIGYISPSPVLPLHDRFPPPRASKIQTFR